MSVTIDWQQIDDVMFDMDGTLLDLHFDNHFWLEYVPKKYAEHHEVKLTEAKRLLEERYKAIESTLDWYCVDHWSRELGFDIALLKEEVDHLIAVHPFVVEFLEKVKAMGKRTILVTNAHQKSLALKMKKTRLDHHFDEIITAHQFGHAKESQDFWHKLHAFLPFDPCRTLFIDDSEKVLASARQYGICHILGILNPDSKAGQKQLDGYDAVTGFREIMPK